MIFRALPERLSDAEIDEMLRAADTDGEDGDFDEEEEETDNDGDDLYIIGAVCLSVTFLPIRV